MAAPSRATQFSQMHKVLKKHYKPTAINVERSVLESVLFACLAENAHYDVAEEAYAAIVETYYDWNEVRVTTIRELSEAMGRLPDPPAAATRMRRVLQHVFENGYVFDLEHLRKQNLGPTVAELQKIDGATPFVVSYVIQASLGGHAIPLDAGSLEVMQILELATDKEVEEANIAGLERAIPKNQGAEFGSLLHELAADFVVNPFATALKKIILQINPDAKDRLPKRGEKEKEAAPEKASTKKSAKAESEGKAAAKKSTAKKASAKKAPAKKVAKRKIVPVKKKVKAPKKATKTPAKKVALKKTEKKAAPKKTATKKTVKKETDTKKAAPKKKATAKKSSKGITKRKPR